MARITIPHPKANKLGFDASRISPLQPKTMTLTSRNTREYTMILPKERAFILPKPIPRVPTISAAVMMAGTIKSEVFIVFSSHDVWFIITSDL